MNIFISLIVVIVGYVFFLLTIGHLILVLRIGNPITKILKDLGIVKYNIHTIHTIFCVIFFVLATSLIYIFLNNFFIPLVLGYALSIVIIIKNFKSRYSINNSSFNNWYLKDYYDKFDFSLIPDDRKSFFQDTDNMFNFILTVLKSK